MPIYKMDGRKDGLQKYRVRINYIDKDGKNKQLDRVAYGKEAAKDLERKLSMDLKTGELVVNRMTVQQLCDEYLTVKKAAVRETSLNRIRRRLQLHILDFCKDEKIADLNPRKLQEWKTYIEGKKSEQGQPLIISTKQGIYSEFRALLNYAVKMEYLQKNYLLTVGNFIDAYKAHVDIDFYEPEEFKEFISAARKSAEASEKATNSIYEWHYYIFFCIAFYAGLRKGEIFALKWTDLRGDMLSVTRSINQKLKGDDRETPPKTKASVRTLQMPEPLISALKEHRNRCEGIEGFSPEWRICGGAMSVRDSTVGKKNIQYATAAGVKHIRIHDFRHSHASLLANNGINIQEIARRLGHGDVQTTWKVYAHLYPKEEERAVKVLNEIKI